METGFCNPVFLMASFFQMFMNEKLLDILRWYLVLV
jgi:hypothetical protein